MDFHDFATRVHHRYNELAQGELFTVGAPGEDIFAYYLSVFPEGSNPIYKTHTEHDCSCCKQFVRHLGRVVQIGDAGNIRTVWQIEGLESPYREVAELMDAYVGLLPITGIFRTKERAYGTEHTSQLLEDKTVKRWDHFHGKVGDLHYSPNPEEARGVFNAAVQVFRRGLVELKPDALQQVVDLIGDKALYRGEEHLGAVEGFMALQRNWQLSEKSEIFVMRNALRAASRFRNTVIGTLVQDLSEGVDIERAVKSFETKVAPTNYKRTTSLITPRMVQDAMATITELGLEPALHRRLARLSDISVNNVLWVDRSVKPKMKEGGIAELLMASALMTPKETNGATDIGIDEFMQRVVPGATGMEVLLKNRHQGNLMTLTAPVDEGMQPQLFRWPNQFAWSYSGNIADSEMRKAVASRGGRVDGVFRFSHSWNYDKRNASLMDLHVFMPGHPTREDGCHDGYGNTERVGWNHRNHPASGGVQDVDYTPAAPVGYVPVENITFPDLGRMKAGDYVCKIHNWQHRPPTDAGVRAEIEFEGQVFEYEIKRPMKHKEWITVAVVTLRDGHFYIEHKLPSSTSSQPAWGLKTEQFAKVSALMHSPNHWDGNAVGNKHTFFILDGCRTEEAQRGIYNEFLASGLEKHRKVFEVLGDKSKCPPTDEQLSGLGFSSTRGDTVTVSVKTDRSNRLYNVKF